MTPTILELIKAREPQEIQLLALDSAESINVAICDQVLQ